MRVNQAVGGSNQSNVEVDSFAMPPGMRMRYDLAAPALQDCVSGYAIYICDERAPMISWFLPAPAMVTVLLDAGPVAMSTRNRAHVEVPKAAVWGPTSQAYSLTTYGGISVGIGLTAEGWVRFARRSAEAFRDRIVPLSEIVPSANAHDLVEALEALDDDAKIAPLLDALLPRLFDAGREPASTRELEELVTTGGRIGVRDVAMRLSIGPRTLRSVATRCFGMPPKMLLTRARFVRSFATWLMSGEPENYAGIDPSYFDVAHFLRDARHYLNTTPRRFAQRETIYLRASLRARSAVIGAAAHTLHVTAPVVDASPLDGRILTTWVPLETDRPAQELPARQATNDMGVNAQFADSAKSR